MFQKPLFWVVAWAAPCNFRAEGAAVRRVSKGMICSGFQKLLLWQWLSPGHLIALGSLEGQQYTYCWIEVTVFPWLRQSYFGKFCFPKAETHHCYSIAGVTAVWGSRVMSLRGSSTVKMCFGLKTCIILENPGKSIKPNYQGVPDTERHLWLRKFLNFKYLEAERAFREEWLHIYCCPLPAEVFPGHPVLAAVFFVLIQI